METIWTVVIIDQDTNELSTVSFRDSGEAQEYVVEEVKMYDDLADIDEMLDVLETEWYWEDSHAKYYIEEANLK